MRNWVKEHGDLMRFLVWAGGLAVVVGGGLLWVADGGLAPYTKSFRALGDPELADALETLSDPEVADALTTLPEDLARAATERGRIADALDSLSLTTANLNRSVQQMSGEDRRIRQIEGASYVEQPVHRGEPIIVGLPFEMTALGRDCVFLRATTIFNDSRRVSLRGSDIEPWQMPKVGDDAPIRVTPPSELEAGRVEFYALMHFRCDDVEVSEPTSVLAYTLIDTPRPPE